MNDRIEVFISDIPSRLLGGEISNRALPGYWRSCSYSTVKHSGVMIACGEKTNPAPAVINLGSIGMFRIYLGLFKVFEGRTTTIRARLINDRCCQSISTSASERGSDTYIHEIVWKEADLTKQNLIIEAEPGVSCALAWIRLEPIKDTLKTIMPEIKYPMAITDDGHSAFCLRPHRRSDDLLESLDSIRPDTCMKILHWGIGGADLCNYPTRAGTYDYGASRDHVYSYQQILADNLTLWRKKSWDSMRLMKKYAQERKWKFNVSIRMQAFAAHFPFNEEFHSHFFYEHPEWRCVDEKGDMIGRMSYAHKEVQDHLLEIINEIQEYEPDGISLLFTRGMPMVLYELIMRDGFKKKHGTDPLLLSENNVSWLKYKAEVITHFVGRINAVMKPNQRLSAFLPSNKEQCDWGGLDVGAFPKSR